MFFSLKIDLNKLCICQKKKLTEKSVPAETQKDTIFSHLAVKHPVCTKVVGTIHKLRYISKLHNKNIIITNNFL